MVFLRTHWLLLLKVLDIHWYISIGSFSSCRSSCPDVFSKKGVLGNFSKFTGKHLCQRLFLKGLQRYQKRVSGTVVFLWILRNFPEHLFLQKTSGGCFCSWCNIFSPLLCYDSMWWHEVWWLICSICLRPFERKAFKLSSLIV